MLRINHRAFGTPHQQLSCEQSGCIFHLEGRQRLRRGPHPRVACGRRLRAAADQQDAQPPRRRAIRRQPRQPLLYYMQQHIEMYFETWLIIL